jgi:hypothetical protein
MPDQQMPPAPEPTEAAPVSVTPPVHQSIDGSPNGPMPDELKHWNWGAFFLNWIWGIAHNVWIALLILPLGFFGPLYLVMAIYLGIKGNELAWQHRHFQDVNQFKAVQKQWMYWGIGLFALQMIALFFAFSAIIAFIVGASVNHTNFAPSNPSIPSTTESAPIFSN